MSQALRKADFEEISYVYVKGSYVEEGVHVIYDQNGDVAFIEN